jgi:hypothetical protein
MDEYDVFDSCMNDINSIRIMNRICGNIYPNSFGMPIRLQLPQVSQTYGRESIYCKYKIVSIDLNNPVYLNITHLVYFPKTG